VTVTTSRERWAEDEWSLARIGAHLASADTSVPVTIPADLAAAAVAAWQRADDVESTRHESDADRVVRHRAGSLALIGAALESRGAATAAGTCVDLDAWLIGHAFDAADDHGLVHARSQPAPTPPALINVDLEVRSPRPLPALRLHLDRIATVLADLEADGGHLLTAELAAGDPDSSNEPTVGGTLAGLLDVVERLPADAGADWRAATSRRMDIGIESGRGGQQPVVIIEPGTVARLAAAGCEIAVTIYPDARRPTLRLHPLR
jgi:hypothetical protein